ncbi:MAG: hypothetical protein R3F48_00820 [Candidatus Zixiibacteriota bacterium]
MKISIVALLFILATSICADEIPALINYQGRVTDATGAPLADGTYTMVFRIYASSGAPSPIWNSGKQDIAVSGGLFTYTLGSSVPLPHNIFDNLQRYLGIQVESDPEITPRTQFTTVPYTYWALKADTALFAKGLTESADAEYLRNTSDTLIGSLAFYGGSGNAGGIFMYPESAYLLLSTDGYIKVHLDGTDDGRLQLANNNDYVTTVLDADHYANGGGLQLFDNTGTSRINLRAGTSGNNSVILPDDAIDGDEILDEPGIAANSSPSYVSVTSTSEMIDIVTVDITIPAPGYVSVESHAVVNLQGTTGSNGGYLRIDRNEGGTIGDGEYVFLYYFAFASAGENYIPASVVRNYYLSTAGTYTFRLEAQLSGFSAGVMSVGHSYITAKYYPTSYGTVSAVSDVPQGIPGEEELVITNEQGESSTVYKVDLRELELQVKQAKIETQEAYIKQLELERQLEDAKRGNN